MTVKIDMDMPCDCGDCRYSEKGYQDGRIYCRLTKHDFPALDGNTSRFATCPLEECEQENSMELPVKLFISVVLLIMFGAICFGWYEKYLDIQAKRSLANLKDCPCLMVVQNEN